MSEITAENLIGDLAIAYVAEIRRLQSMLDDLNGNMASMQQTNEVMGKKLLAMGGIIDKQREALNTFLIAFKCGDKQGLRMAPELASRFFNIAREALALTQQQTGGAV